MRVSGHNDNDYHEKCDKIALFLMQKFERGYLWWGGGSLSEENARKKGKKTCFLRLFSEYFPEDGLSEGIAIAIPERKATESEANSSKGAE